MQLNESLAEQAEISKYDHDRLLAKIKQLQKELDEAIEIIEFSGVDYDEVLEAIRNDQ